MAVITTSAECEAAATALGIVYSNVVTVDSGAAYPAGCSMHTTGGLLLFRDAGAGVGDASETEAPICATLACVCDQYYNEVSQLTWDRVQGTWSGLCAEEACSLPSSTPGYDAVASCLPAGNALYSSADCNAPSVASGGNGAVPSLNQGSSAGVQCASGFYGTGVATCATNYHEMSFDGCAACTVCGEGAVQVDDCTGSGAGSCECLAGYEPADNASHIYNCRPCGAGHYKSTNGPAACAPCAAECNGANVEQAAECSATSNRICGCMPGTGQLVQSESDTGTCAARVVGGDGRHCRCRRPVLNARRAISSHDFKRFGPGLLTTDWPDATPIAPLLPSRPHVRRPARVGLRPPNVLERDRLRALPGQQPAFVGGGGAGAPVPCRSGQGAGAASL